MEAQPFWTLPKRMFPMGTAGWHWLTYGWTYGWTYGSSVSRMILLSNLPIDHHGIPWVSVQAQEKERDAFKKPGTSTSRAVSKVLNDTWSIQNGSPRRLVYDHHSELKKQIKVPDGHPISRCLMSAYGHFNLYLLIWAPLSQGSSQTKGSPGELLHGVLTARCTSTWFGMKNQLQLIHVSIIHIAIVNEDFGLD